MNTLVDPTCHYHALSWLIDLSTIFFSDDSFSFFQDIKIFGVHKYDFAQKFFDDVPADVIKQEPLIYCHFAKGIGEPKYMPVSWFL